MEKEIKDEYNRVFGWQFKHDKLDEIFDDISEDEIIIFNVYELDDFGDKVDHIGTNLIPYWAKVSIENEWEFQSQLRYCVEVSTAQSMLSEFHILDIVTYTRGDLERIPMNKNNA